MHFTEFPLRTISKGLFVSAAIALAGCSATGSTDALNMIGGVAGSVVGSHLGGAGGRLIANLGSNAGNIATAMDGSEEGEKMQAAQVSEQMIARTGRSRDMQMEQYLQGMTRRLGAAAKQVSPTSRNYKYQVTLLADSSFNAATPGGGRVLVNEGLLVECKTEGQVAAVLAHEIAHVIKRHPKKGQQLGTLVQVGATVLGSIAPQAASGASGGAIGLGAHAVVNGFSREHEAEADAIGMEIMAAAGYDPREMVTVQQVMANIGRREGALDNFFFSNHPTGQARIAAMDKKWRELTGAKRGGVVDTPAYQALAAKYRRQR